MEINQQPTHGSATVETDQTITYGPEIGFNQEIDTVFYKVSMAIKPNISDSSMMVIFVNLPVGIDGESTKPGLDSLSQSYEWAVYDRVQ